MIKCFDFSSSDHRNTPTSLSLERPAICFCILNRDGENVSGHIPLRSGTFRMCALWSLEKKMTNFFHFLVFSFFLFFPLWKLFNSILLHRRLRLLSTVCGLDWTSDEVIDDALQRSIDRGIFPLYRQRSSLECLPFCLDLFLYIWYIITSFEYMVESHTHTSITITQ